MPARSDRRRWSYAEFARLPSDDGNRYEIIAGALYVTPAPRPLHQHVIRQLLDRLGRFVDSHRLGWVLPGPIDILFAEGDYLEPDLVFVRRERRGIITDRGLEEAPDLVVEVLSASTAARDRGIKRERYALYGVPEYWVADPDEQRIEVHRPQEDPATVRIHTDVLTWAPAADGPTLEISVPAVLAGFD
ncbi:MAG TPA: Uma2 family endonuclease [Longimicrobiales bacterium]